MSGYIYKSSRDGILLSSKYNESHREISDLFCYIKYKNEMRRKRRSERGKHMGLTIWKDAPDGKVQRFDVVIAKNYFTKEELSAMARLTKKEGKRCTG